MKFAYINGKILNGDEDMQVRQGLINMHVHLAGNGKLIDNPKVKINRLVEKELDRFL